MAYCDGPGITTLKIGIPAFFSINVPKKDSSVTRQEIVVSIVSADTTIPFQLYDNKDGSFDVDFEPRLHGPYVITVIVQGNHVVGSPFRPSIALPGPSSEELLLLSGNDLPCLEIQSKEGKVGELCFFSIHQVLDALQISVDVVGPEIIKPDILMISRRSVDVEFLLNTPGSYMIFVKYKGNFISPSPFEYRVYGTKIRMLSTSAPQDIVLEGIGENGWKGRVGDICAITVNSSRFQKKDIKVYIDGPSVTISPRIIETKDKIIRVEWKSYHPGEYKMQILAGGKPLKGSPFRAIFFEESTRSRDPVAEGSGLISGKVGNVCIFTVSANTSKDQVLVTISGPNNISIPTNPTYMKDGCFDVEYIPEVPGPYSIDVKVNGKPVKNSPFVANIADKKRESFIIQQNSNSFNEAPDPNRCTAEGPGLISVKVETLAIFTIYVKDVYGKPVLIPTEDISIFGLAPVKSQVYSNKDGSYDVEYKPTKAGKYSIEIKIRNQMIKNSPFLVDVFPSLKDLNFIVSGLGPKGGEVGDCLSFVCTARDKNGNVVTIKPSDININITGPSENIIPNLSVDPTTNGISVSFVPLLPGDYPIFIELFGEKLHSCVVKINPKPDANIGRVSSIGSAHCVPMKSSSNCLVNSLCYFSVFVYENVSGGNLKKGGHSLSVTYQDGPISTVANVIDNKDGTYKVRFIPKLPGFYVWKMNFNGVTINNSTFTVWVNSDPPVSKFAIKGNVTRGIVSRTSTFMASPQTSSGSPIQLPINALEVSIVDPNHNKIPANITITSKGFLVSYVPLRSVAYNISLSLYKKVFWSGSCNVREDSLVVPSNVVNNVSNVPNLKCVLRGLGLTKGYTRCFNHFTIHVTLGGEMKSIPSAALSVEINGPVNVSPKITDNGNGSFRITYRTDIAGTYFINAFLFNKPVLDQAIQTQIFPKTNALF